jgi:pyruvate/2-oxoglutarate dehydrogenase complex dihydrolipoamide acyltransferase (E2) component
MEAGTIGAWNVKEGDAFDAGTVVAEIETDKATMGFEAQDPGVVAKILVEAGEEVTSLTTILARLGLDSPITSPVGRSRWARPSWSSSTIVTT